MASERKTAKPKAARKATTTRSPKPPRHPIDWPAAARLADAFLAFPPAPLFEKACCIGKALAARRSPAHAFLANLLMTELGLPDEVTPGHGERAVHAHNAIADAIRRAKKFQAPLDPLSTSRGAAGKILEQLDAAREEAEMLANRAVWEERFRELDATKEKAKATRAAVGYFALAAEAILATAFPKAPRRDVRARIEAFLLADAAAVAPECALCGRPGARGKGGQGEDPRARLALPATGTLAQRRQGIRAQRDKIKRELRDLRDGRAKPRSLAPGVAVGGREDWGFHEQFLEHLAEWAGRFPAVWETISCASIAHQFDAARQILRALDVPDDPLASPAVTIALCDAEVRRRFALVDGAEGDKRKGRKRADF